MEPKRERDAAAVRVFPPAIPLLTVLGGIGLNRLWPIDLGFEFPAPERYWVGGLIVAGAVLGLGWRSVVQLRRTGQSENPWKPTTQIVDTGPFRLTRNPMYLQMVLVCIGIAVALMNLWILALTPVSAWLLQRLAILPEEDIWSESLARPTWLTSTEFAVGYEACKPCLVSHDSAAQHLIQADAASRRGLIQA